MFQVLFALLGGLFAGLVNFLLKFFTKKVAIRLTVIAMFLTLTVAFVGYIYAIIQGLHYVFPPFLSVPMGWFIPNNAPVCLAAYMSALLVRWVYDVKTKITQYTVLNYA